MRMAPTFSEVEYLVPTWWNCLQRIGKGSLVGGGVVLGAGFEVSNDTYHFQFLTLCRHHICGSHICKLSITAPVPWLMSCSQPWRSWTLTVGNCKPQIYSFFSKLPWSWCLITAMEMWLRQAFWLRVPGGYSPPWEDMAAGPEGMVSGTGGWLVLLHS